MHASDTYSPHIPFRSTLPIYIIASIFFSFISIIPMLLFPSIHRSEFVLCKNGIVVQRKREKKALITSTDSQKSKIKSKSKSKIANVEGTLMPGNNVLSFD